MGVVSTGMGWGGILMVPLATFLIINNGWRTAYVVLGIATAVILTPMMFFTMKTLKPEEMGLLPDGKMSLPKSEEKAAAKPKTEQIPLWTLRTSMRTTAFWLLWVGLFIFYIGQSSTIFHAAALFKDKGASVQLAGTLVSVIAGVGIAGKLISGYLADRMTVRHLTAFTSMLHVVALVIILRVTGLHALWAYAIFFGIAMGAIGTLGPVLVAQCFGRPSFGAIYGTIAIATTAGVGLGPTFFGYVYDRTGSYDPALLLYIATFTLAALAFLLARPPKPAIVLTPKPAA